MTADPGPLRGGRRRNDEGGEPVKISQDAALGSFFVAVGAVGLFVARDYPFGTANRMGPGYFPLIISSLLVLTGVAILMRARFGSAEAIAGIRWKPLAIVSCAVFLFGALVEKLGLPLAVLLLVVGAATASVKFRLDWKATAGAAAFSVVCAVAFVDLLGVPMPLAGSWLHAVGF